MKKIRRIQDIEQEKLRLRVQQLELEKQLHESWKLVKTNLSPGTLLRNKLSEFGHRTNGEGHWLEGLLQVGAGYLGNYSGSKVEDTLLKGVDYLAEKFKHKTRR